MSDEFILESVQAISKSDAVAKTAEIGKILWYIILPPSMWL